MTGDSISLKSALATPTNMANHTPNHDPLSNNVSSTNLNHGGVTMGEGLGPDEHTPAHISMVSAALGVAGGVAAGPSGSVVTGNNGVGGGRSASTVNLNMGKS